MKTSIKLSKKSPKLEKLVKPAKTEKTEKLYIIRKYIYAPSAKLAISRETKHPVDDCWVDDDWKKNQASIQANLASPIGFVMDKTEEQE